MTIYTPNIADRKENKDEDSPVVCTEDVPDLEFKKKTIEDEDVLLPQQPAAVLIARRRRNKSFCQLLLLFCTLITLALGVVTGIYLYKYITRPYIARCGVIGRTYDVKFEFEEIIETDERKYEKIEVPAINDFRKATILHDFDNNYTAIVDKFADRCFVMPLNRSLVRPPRDLWDLVSKIESGYYLPDEEMVRENYRVLQPAVRDLTPFGYYIWIECRYYNTYRMQRLDGRGPQGMVKRSSSCETLDFVEYSGTKVHGYNIEGCFQ